MYQGYIRPIIEYADVITYSETVPDSGEYSKKGLQNNVGLWVCLVCKCTWNMWSWSSVCSAWDSPFEFCAFAAKIWEHQNANPRSRQEIHGKQLRNSTNITQLLARTNRFAQSSYLTTLACLIPPSLPSWWLLRCPLPLVLFEAFSSVYLCLVLFCFVLFFFFFCCLYIFFLCSFVWRDSAFGLRCYAIKSYHIISYHL